MYSWEFISSSQPTACPSPATSNSESVNLSGEQLSIYTHPVTPPTPLSQHQTTPLPHQDMYHSSWAGQAQDYQSPHVIDLRAEHCGEIFSTEHQPLPQSPAGWNPQLSFPVSTGYGDTTASAPLGIRDYNRGPSISASSDSSAYSSDISEPRVKVEEDVYWEGFSHRERDEHSASWYSYDPSARSSVATDDRAFESRVKLEDDARMGLPAEYPSSLMSTSMTVSPQNLSVIQTTHDSRLRGRVRAPASEHPAGAPVGLGITEPQEGHQGVTGEPGSSAISGQHYSPLPFNRRKKRVRTEPPNGSKELQCQQCFVYFKRKYNLQKHQITHDANRKKDFACPERKCNLKFARKADCMRHVQSVHIKSKPHRCLRCDAAFDRRDTLMRHSEDGGGCPMLRKKFTEESSENKAAPSRRLHPSRPLPLRRSKVDPTLLPAPDTPLLERRPFLEQVQNHQ